MIHTAKAIAANGQVIVRFANVISDQCTDKRSECNQCSLTLSVKLDLSLASSITTTLFFS